jgi:hypothetical protein
MKATWICGGCGVVIVTSDIDDYVAKVSKHMETCKARGSPKGTGK